MEDLLWVAGVMGFAVFLQTAMGFGSALVAMPLLITKLGLMTAAPLVALMTLTTRLVMLSRYRATFRLADVWRLMLSAAVGIPLGLIIFYRLDQTLVEVILGGLLVGYAVFMLVKPRLVWFQHKNWAYGLGFLSGVLAGAYNIGGPPAVVYATGKRWPPVTAKSNLQLISLLSGFLVIATRATNHEFTEIVLGHYLLGLPAIVIGLWIGFSSDGWLNGEGFRRGMLLLLLLIGMNLLI